MKKITIENLHENPQYVAIIFTLARFGYGLSLHDLTYLLTKRKKMNKFSYLQEKFPRVRRKAIFKTRQRICDCLRSLKTLGFVNHKEGLYKLDLETLFYWCEIQDASIAYRDRLVKAKEKCSKLFDDIRITYPEKVDDLETEFIPITIKRNFKELYRKYRNL